MNAGRELPSDPLDFIRRCIEKRQIFWPYHVNMRLQRRHIPREAILEAVGSFEIIESYPDDKYLPSYLVYAMAGGSIFHVLFATDIPGDNVRVVTAYRPDPAEWSEDLKRRVGR